MPLLTCCFGDSGINPVLECHTGNRLKVLGIIAISLYRYATRKAIGKPVQQAIFLISRRLVPKRAYYIPAHVGREGEMALPEFVARQYGSLPVRLVATRPLPDLLLEIAVV